jgi:hypothetical protein
VQDGEASEAARVDEAKLLAAAEGEDGVGVWRDGCVWGGDEEAAGHAEVDEELGGGGKGIRGREAGLSTTRGALRSR